MDLSKLLQICALAGVPGTVAILDELVNSKVINIEKKGRCALCTP